MSVCVCGCVCVCVCSWINELVKQRWRGRRRQVLLSCSTIPDLDQRLSFSLTHSHTHTHTHTHTVPRTLGEEASMVLHPTGSIQVFLWSERCYWLKGMMPVVMANVFADKRGQCGVSLSLSLFQFRKKPPKIPKECRGCRVAFTSSSCQQTLIQRTSFKFQR